MQNEQICSDFDSQDKATKLKLIRKTIQHKEMGMLAKASGVHISVVSTYLKHAGKIVLNTSRVDRILAGWKKIEENKIRNYF